MNYVGVHPLAGHDFDAPWARDLVSSLPSRWRGRLLGRWNGKRRGDGRRGANLELLAITERLQKVRLPLDASDGDICARADEFAAAAMDLGRVHSDIAAVRAGMESFVRTCLVEPPAEKVEDCPAIARMTCRDWWRRGLRKLHAKAVEGAAIQLGYVKKTQDIYVSNETLERRRQQLRRGAAMMEATRMRNEEGQEYTLAELAALGVGNKAIRRGELMTRIAGLEKVARECGHAGLFLTVTCPSRMHKWSSVAGGVVENAKYDGTTPREAQQYLSKCWSRVRAKLARHGASVYGFRIAEPHHDGCPHWHMLFFCEPWAKRRIVHTFRDHMLRDSAGEAGAAVHRVKVEVIDWSRGTAAGYVAKYVSKNIDGLHVENDLFGNPAMETAARVEAWASTWGIRQFQQIGGAPVGVWRELRRVAELPDGVPDHLRRAWEAVNKGGVNGRFLESQEEKKADFGDYVRAQGGPLVGRGALVRVAREVQGGLSRYGEERAPTPVGVETVGGEYYRDGIVPNRFRLVEWFVRSVRHVWEVVKRGVQAAVFSPPRTCVNNCTREGGQDGDLQGGRVGRQGGSGARKGSFDRSAASESGGSAFDWFVEGAFG